MFNLKAPKTLDQILDGFHSTIDSLNDLINRNTSRVIENNHRISELVETNETLNDESARAMKVMKKLSALIED